MKTLKDMDTSKWSIAGVLFGLVFGIMSSVRYYLLFPDQDKFLAYGIIAVCIIGISWCYNEIKQIYTKFQHVENNINAIEDQLDIILNGGKK